MYRHIRNDRLKWAALALVILVIGVLIAGIMTNWFTDGNPYCWFGHTYEEGSTVCEKCGAEKVVEANKKDDNNDETPATSESEDAETAAETAE